MEKQRTFIVTIFHAGLLAVILSSGIAQATPPFDPHTAEGGLPQCKADLATCTSGLTQAQAKNDTCLNNLASCTSGLTQIQTEYGTCLNDLGSCTANLSTCEAELTACLQTTGVQRTGQTDEYGLGDDGDLQMGVMWSSPRFTDNNNGTVTDNFTGLIWTQNANLFPKKNWSKALESCNGLANGIDKLSDGSSPGDWRLPNLRELQSLIDFSRFNPSLPKGHPFTTNVQSVYYWSSTTYADASYGGSYAWLVSLSSGSMTKDSKSYSFNFWCVRDGQ